MSNKILWYVVLAVGAAAPCSAEGPVKSGLVDAVKVELTYSAPFGIWYEDEAVSVKVRLENRSDVPVTASDTCDVWRVHGRLQTGPGQAPVEAEKVEELRVPGALLPRQGAAEWQIEPKTKRFGCFSLTVAVSGADGTKALTLGTFIRIWRPEEGFQYDSRLMVPQFGWGISKDMLWCVEALSRLGIKWVRTTVRWPSIQARENRWDWSYCEDFMNLCRKHGLYVNALAVHSPDFALPNGKPVNRPGRGLDATPAADKMEAWAKFFATVSERYRDVIRSWEVWNEPWEGGGITEYGACGEHYRNMHLAAYRAVKSVDPHIVVGSNDSEANCTDNLLCEPGFEKYFDVGFVHQYNTFQSYGPEFFAAMGKECWDTESWNFHTGLNEMTALDLLLFLFGRGQQKASPVIGNDLFPGNRPGRGPTPAAASFATLNLLLADTHVEARINPLCGPWIWVYHGKKRAVAAILGRLGVPGQAWDQQDRDGKLILNSRGGQLAAFDRYGDPLPNRDGRCEVPLTQSPYYVTAKPRKLRALKAALQAAVIEGIAPVQIALSDFTRPLDQKPVLRASIRNAYNVPLSGRATFEVPNAITLERNAVEFGPLGPGQTTRVELPVVAGTPHPDNRYPVRCRIESDQGSASLEEALSVAVFRFGTPTIDGDLSEWEKLGAMPVYVAAGKFTYDPALTGWFPFKKWDDDTGAAYFGKFAAMWDETNLYFMAQVNDPTLSRHPGPLSGTWFQMMDPPCDHVYAMGPKFVFSADQVQVAFDCCPNPDTLLPPDDPAYRDGSFRNTDYEFGLMDTAKDGSIVWRYLAPGLRWHHYYPFSPRLPFDQGVVASARLVVRREEPKALWTYEAAIPLDELKELRPRPGKLVRFAFRLNQDGRSHVDWSHGRSACKKNAFSFHPEWVIDYSVETEWGFETR